MREYEILALIENVANTYYNKTEDEWWRELADTAAEKMGKIKWWRK